jgi:dihydrofolate synthase/folylpolyglutamate synthase
LEKIAFEKAGIIKPTTPVVIGESLPETRPVFVRKAKEENASIYFAEEKCSVNFIEYSDAKMLVEVNGKLLIKCGLCGNYQLKNIATTLTAIEQLIALNYSISESDILKGFENITEITGLQGRWQTLRSNPTVVCDTGHNVGGIQFVVEQLKAQNYKKLRIVIGMVNDKDVSAVLNLLPKDAIYYFTQANIIRALPCEELKSKAQSFGLSGVAYQTVEQAVETSIKESNSDDFIFIGGSNFIVGDALPLF